MRESLNLTGIPEELKTKFETMSGDSFDDVRVHYNSDKPSKLPAMAYTQDNQVYIAPGQERHLPHELGHIIQQKQGRVRPTLHINGVGINNDAALEREADAMAENAANYSDAKAHYSKFLGVTQRKNVLQGRFGSVIQADCFWPCDANGYIKNPVPITDKTKAAAPYWLKEGKNDNQRMYNSNNEAKAAAAAAVITSFASQVVKNDNIVKIKSKKNDVFLETLDTYGQNVNKYVKDSNDVVNEAVDAFDIINEKLNTARTAILTLIKAKHLPLDGLSAAQKTKAVTDAEKIFKNVADMKFPNFKNKKAAIEKTVSNTINRAQKNADKTASNEVLKIKNKPAPNNQLTDDERARILSLASVDVDKTFFGNLADIAAYSTGESTLKKHQQTVADWMTRKLFCNKYGGYQYNRKQVWQKQEPMSDDPDKASAYQKGVGSYRYYKSTLMNDDAKIKKGTPVIAVHTEDPSMKIKKKLLNGVIDEYAKVRHWHAGIVNEEITKPSKAEEQPAYKLVGKIVHYIVKPTK